MAANIGLEFLQTPSYTDVMGENHTARLDYRSYLQEELADRIDSNPSYSIRAMARDLSLSPGYFSQVLSEKRILSEAKAIEIGRKLKWSPRKIDTFVKLIQYRKTKTPEQQMQLLQELNCKQGPKKQFKDLKLEKFKLVSRWIHFAILELMSTKGFQPKAQWIAKKLGITTHEAKSAVQRLLDLNMVSEKNGKLKKNENFCVDDTPSAAIKEFHSRHLDLAYSALKSQDMSTRDFGGVTMAIDPKNLPKAKKLIHKFHEDMMNLLESGTQTQVYHFSTQLYRLDKEI